MKARQQLAKQRGEQGVKVQKDRPTAKGSQTVTLYLFLHLNFVYAKQLVDRQNNLTFFLILEFYW